MKRFLIPFFKGLSLIIQTIIAILITIIWVIPTLLICIVYPIIYFIWEFKIKYYEFKIWKTDSWDDSSTVLFLWSKHNIRYESYFHRIWNINEKTINPFTNIINTIKSKLN